MLTINGLNVTMRTLLAAVSIIIINKLKGLI